MRWPTCVAKARCVGTMDAGPNVKVLTTPEDAPRVEAVLKQHVQTVHTLHVGGPARLV